MRKLLTGEPYAGEPPVRFGGKGDRKVFLTPIYAVIDKWFFSWSNYEMLHEK